MAKPTSHRRLAQQAEVHCPAEAQCEVLLVSRSARLFERIAVALGDTTDVCYHITPVANLENAAHNLGEHTFQVLLLDWSLATEPATPALVALLEAAPTVAVLALLHDAEPARADAARRIMCWRPTSMAVAWRA